MPTPTNELRGDPWFGLDSLKISPGIIGYYRPNQQPQNDPEYGAQGQIGHFFKALLLSHIVQLVQCVKAALRGGQRRKQGSQQHRQQADHQKLQPAKVGQGGSKRPDPDPPAQVASRTNKKNHTKPLRRVRLRVNRANRTHKVRATARDIRNSLRITVFIFTAAFL